MNFTSNELMLYMVLGVIVAVLIISAIVEQARRGDTSFSLDFIEREDGLCMRFSDSSNSKEDSIARFRKAFYPGKIVRHDGKSYCITDMLETEQDTGAIVCSLKEQ